MRRDTLMKSSTTYVALGWTRISMDKMFSELLALTVARHDEGGKRRIRGRGKRWHAMICDR